MNKEEKIIDMIKGTMSDLEHEKTQCLLNDHTSDNIVDIQRRAANLSSRIATLKVVLDNANRIICDDSYDAAPYLEYTRVQALIQNIRKLHDDTKSKMDKCTREDRITLGGEIHAFSDLLTFLDRTSIVSNIKESLIRSRELAERECMEKRFGNADVDHVRGQISAINKMIDVIEEDNG